MDDLLLGVDDWRAWRLECAGLVWRAAVPKDAASIEALADRNDRRLGQVQDRPDFFAPPVLLTLVAEDEMGEIVDAFYIELVADITKLTTNRKGYAAFEKLTPVIGSFLESRKVRVAQMSVATRWARAMGPSLMARGFRRVDAVLSHWVRKVRE